MRWLYITTLLRHQAKPTGQRVHTPACRQNPILPFPGEGTGGMQRLPQSPPVSAILALVGVERGRTQAVEPASPTFTAILLAQDGKCPQTWLRKLRVP